MAAGGGVRAFLLAGVAVFRRGDEACFHRNACPDGRSDCASRFRLGPTHSLLLRRHLGRNLITVFSTVNTPREKKRRDTPRATRARRAGRDAHPLSMDADVSHPRAAPRNETSFFKRFFPAPLERDTMRADCERHRTRRCEGARERMNGVFPACIRSGGISRRTSPIARKCANRNRTSTPSTKVEVTRVRCRDAPTMPHPIRIARLPTTCGSDLVARLQASRAALRGQRKSRPRGRGRLRGHPGRAACGRAAELSARRLPAVRRSRPDRAAR